MNIHLVVGSNGIIQKNNKIGTMLSEFKLQHLQLINLWETEPQPCGQVNLKEEFFILPPIPTLIWKEEVIQIYSKMFSTRIVIKIGILSILAIPNLKNRHMFISNGVIQKIPLNILKLNISVSLNSIFLLEKTNNIQDTLGRLLWQHLTLEKEPSVKAMISKLKMMYLE